MLACTTTKWFAAEYEKQYYLAEDVNLYSAHIFTGRYSVWISGPQKVETICSSKVPVAGAKLLKKGSPVRVLELFEIEAIDASYSDAKLEIVDTRSGAKHTVYIKWPGSSSLLTTVEPNEK